MIELYATHSIGGCKCDPYRREVLTVRGTKYLVHLPACHLWVGGNRSPIRECVEAVENHTGYRIIKYDDFFVLFDQFCMGTSPYDVVGGLNPVIRALGRVGAYYLKRDVLAAIAKLRSRCVVCNKTAGRLYGESVHVNVPTGDIKNPFHYELACVCSNECKQIHRNESNRLWEEHEGQAQQYRTNRKVIKQCKRQMTLLRKVLKNDDPQASSLLREELRRQASSPG